MQVYMFETIRPTAGDVRNKPETAAFSNPRPKYQWKLSSSSFWGGEPQDLKLLFPLHRLESRIPVEVKGCWQTESPKHSVHSPLDSFRMYFVPSHPHKTFFHPSLVQLFLAGKHILTLNRLIPPAKPNSEGFANLLGSQRTVKMEQRFVWLNTIAGRQGRKRRTGKNKCLRFYVDTRVLFTDQGLQSQGRWWGSFTCCFIPYLGESRGAQCGHLALPHLLLPEASSTSLPQFPHRYLLGTQALGRFISLTPSLPGCKIPKIQETDSSKQHALLCIPRFSFQPDELQGKEEPGDRLAVSISSPSSPSFTPHAGQQLLPVFLHWEQAPAPTEAEGCAKPPVEGPTSPSLWALGTLGSSLGL